MELTSRHYNALVFAANEWVEFGVRYAFSPFLSIFYIAIIAPWRKAGIIK
ncbi:hypothetical protein [Bacillus sp. Bos-x628]